MSIKICNKCSEHNLASAMVCSFCGSTLSNAKIITDKEEKPNYIVCPNCDIKLKLGTRNCPDCGEFLAKGNQGKPFKKDYNNSYTQHESSNVFLYIVSLLIPLVGFISGAILLTNDDVYKKDEGKLCIVLSIISVVIGGVLIVSF